MEVCVFVFVNGVDRNVAVAKLTAVNRQIGVQGFVVVDERLDEMLFNEVGTRSLRIIRAAAP